MNDYPSVKRWFEAIASRPAVQRGIAVLAQNQHESHFGKNSVFIAPILNNIALALRRLEKYDQAIEFF